MNAQDHLSDAENDLTAGRLSGAVQHVIYAISALAEAEREATPPSDPAPVVGDEGCICGDDLRVDCSFHGGNTGEDGPCTCDYGDLRRDCGIRAHREAVPPNGDGTQPPPGWNADATPAQAVRCGAPLSAGSWRQEGDTCGNRTRHASGRCAKHRPTPDAPPAPAPGEDAVEAINLALNDALGSDDPGLDLLAALDRGAVPGYGRTGTGDGAGEHEARERDESILVHAMRRHPGVIRHQPDQAGIGACGTTSTGFLREYDEAIENAYQRGRAAR